MRQLTEKEVEKNEKAIKEFKEKLKELNYSKKYDELQLSEGLEIQFTKAKNNIEQNYKSVLKEIEETEKLIKILREQNEFGVEEK